MMTLVGRWRQRRICIAIHQTQHRIYYARRVCCMPGGCLLRQWSILHIDNIDRSTDSEIDFFMSVLRRSQLFAAWFSPFISCWFKFQSSQNISKLKARSENAIQSDRSPQKRSAQQLSRSADPQLYHLEHFWIPNWPLLATRKISTAQQHYDLLMMEKKRILK